MIIRTYKPSNDQPHPTVAVIDLAVKFGDPAIIISLTCSNKPTPYASLAYVLYIPTKKTKRPPQLKHQMTNPTPSTMEHSFTRLLLVQNIILFENGNF